MCRFHDWLKAESMILQRNYSGDERVRWVKGEGDNHIIPGVIQWLIKKIN